ncbi:hypothetical protein [Streptomyces sp. NPDC047042]
MATDLPSTTHDILLAESPAGLPGPGHLTIAAKPMPLPGPGQVVVRN